MEQMNFWDDLKFVTQNLAGRSAEDLLDYVTRQEEMIGSLRLLCVVCSHDISVKFHLIELSVCI